MYKKTCYNCHKIFETETPFSFYCNNCCRILLDLKPQKTRAFGIASYSGSVTYLKHILKQKDWIDLLNGKRLTHSKF